MNWQKLERNRAARLVKRANETALIDGEVVECLFYYPTEEQALKNQGGGYRSRLSGHQRIPEIHVLKTSAITFKQGLPVRLLCRSGSPDFVIAEVHYDSDSLVRLELVEEQEPPADTQGRGWR